MDTRDSESSGGSEQPLGAAYRDMIKILEMEFGATPDEILTTVAMSLKDHDSDELAEILNTTSGLLDILMPGNSPYKARRR
ncbi:MAG: hypothetical protein EOO77_32330 [Oxalobacteraceae bacterium]|nr:MAG: hypothetical protein EOO77_32330 [Oxalobacteraceae bacterium]